MKYCGPPWLADEENFRFKLSKTARKTNICSGGGLQTYIINRFKSSQSSQIKFRSQSFQIFKFFGGLKFRFEVLIILVIKLNVPIELSLF